MLAPLSWLKDFVEINLPVQKLADRLTEVGLAAEAIHKESDDIIFDLEVTPNRPDWLSILGIGREVAAICQTKVKPPKIRELPKPKHKLPIKIVNDFSLIPRYTAVIVDNLKVKPSPLWLQERIKKVGLRPINNLVDITNYVMFELGNPLHAFDYNKLNPKQILIRKAKGGERFVSVDEISYLLPKDAIIIKDSPDRVIDLCGIKGGLNSGISQTTKTVFLHAPTHPPALIRRASQALSLKSEASVIFERGVDVGGALDALKRAANLMLELGGGEIASDLFDLKKKSFKSWKLTLSHQKLEKVLGVKFSQREVVSILESLGLKTKVLNPKRQLSYQILIPTFRGDLKIEEDLIEEVARIHDYNKFPLTLPAGEIPTEKVPFSKDYFWEDKVKTLLKGAGFTEIYTFSLISKELLNKVEMKPKDSLSVTNPVSSDFKYLRPSLIPELLSAVALNQPNFDKIKIFELGRVYTGKPKKTNEPIHLTGAITGENKFYEAKGVVETLLKELGIKNYKFEPYATSHEPRANLWHPFRSALTISHKSLIIGTLGEIHPQILSKFCINQRATVFDLDFDQLVNLATTRITYQPIPKYPPIIEDLSIKVDLKVLTGDLIEAVKKVSKIVRGVELIDVYNGSKTFRITYQDLKRNLKDQEIKEIRKRMIKTLEKKFRATPKI